MGFKLFGRSTPFLLARKAKIARGMSEYAGLLSVKINKDMEIIVQDGRRWLSSICHEGMVFYGTAIRCLSRLVDLLCRGCVSDF